MVSEIKASWNVPHNERKQLERFWCNNVSEFGIATSRAARSNSVTTFYLKHFGDPVGRMNMYSPVSVLFADGREPTEIHDYRVRRGKYESIDNFTSHGYYILHSLPLSMRKYVYRGDVIIFDEYRRNRGLGTKMIKESLDVFGRVYYQGLSGEGYGYLSFGMTQNPAMVKALQKNGGVVDNRIIPYSPNLSECQMDLWDTDLTIRAVRTKYQDGSTLRQPFDNKPDDMLLLLKDELVLGYILPERRISFFNKDKHLPLNGQAIGFLNPQLVGEQIQMTALTMKPFLQTHRWSSLFVFKQSELEESPYITGFDRRDDFTVTTIPF